MQWIYYKTVNFCGIYFSLAETFELFWSSFVEGKKKKEQKIFTIRLSTRRIKLNKLTFGTPWLPDLLCKHQYVVSSLRCKHLSWRNVPSGEQGKMAVFAGSDEDNLTDIFNLITVKSVLNLVNLYILGCQNYRIQGLIYWFFFYFW